MKFFNRSKKNNNNPEEVVSKRKPNPIGHLAIDIYQTPDFIIIQAPIAGVSLKEIEVHVENNTLFIKGKRIEPIVKGLSEEEKDYLYRECYWGSFSREVILSKEVDTSRAESFFDKGILLIRLPKIQSEKIRKIQVEGSA